MFRQPLTREQALNKIKHYCAYQERCHQEVNTKLFQLGVRRPDREEIMATLIQEGFLNEERFAIQFAGGKFRMKQWGRVRIRQALREKQVSAYCIEKALRELDDVAYRKTLHALAEKKWVSVRGPGTNRFVKLSKTRDFLLQKGYESYMIHEVLRELETN